jgi:hypothetical protein
MADENGFGYYVQAVQQQLTQIAKTLETIREENFTKADMNVFKEDVCSPRGIQQKEISDKVEGHEKFKIQILAIVIVISTLIGGGAIVINFLQMQNMKIELKNTSAVETSKAVQTIATIEKGKQWK